MSIPSQVLLAELRRYAVRCEGDAARARVIADAAWAQYQQASADERDDVVAEALIQHRARGLKSARSATKGGEMRRTTTTPLIHTSAAMGIIADRCGLDANLPHRQSAGAMRFSPACPRCAVIQPMRRIVVMRLRGQAALL